MIPTPYTYKYVYFEQDILYLHIRDSYIVIVPKPDFMGEF